MRFFPAIKERRARTINQGEGGSGFVICSTIRENEAGQMFTTSIFLKKKKKKAPPKGFFPLDQNTADARGDAYQQHSLTNFATGSFMANRRELDRLIKSLQVRTK